MKEDILSNLDNPIQLERMYRENKSAFKQAFNSLYAEIDEREVAEFWNARLNFSKGELSWGNKNDLIVVLAGCIVAIVLAKLPSLLNLNEEFYYPRNIGFIVFPVLSAYFAWKNNLSIGKVLSIAAVMLAGAIFINALPDVKTSHTLILSCIHLVLVLWSMWGVAFVGGYRNDSQRRLEYLAFNGDLIVISTLILIAGALLTIITIALFRFIGLNIEDFYFKNIVISGVACAPLIGTYLTRSNPQLVEKVSPVIARIFGPLVLVTLVIYLIAILYQRKDPYNDREFLIVFNVLLIGVMAIIFFSVVEYAKSNGKTREIWVLLLLGVVAAVVNGIALSAIIYRVIEFGITPNRMAVLGGNILMLVNLLMVALQLARVLRRKSSIGAVGNIIAWYLPVYAIWAMVVTVLFPLVFGLV
jgi:hypothetical protein